jgi:DNA-binding transcriptional LysR family regulator
VNSVEAMSHFCELDLGLATLAEWQVVDLIKQRKLVNVLPEWKVTSIPLYAVWPNNVYENSLVKKILKILSN